MAELSIGDAVAEGFTLIRRKPLTVLAWGVVEMVFAAGVLAVFAPVYLGLIPLIVNSAHQGATSSPPVDFASMVQTQMQMQGVGYLVSLISSFVRVVIYCAVMRAVLHPQDSRFAYLRIGAAELLLYLLFVAAYIAFVVALIVPIAILIALLAALAVAKAGVAAVIVGVIGFLALIMGILYVALRFSLVAPMMVDDGKFHLFDAWALTRKHAGGLFVVALCIMAILLIGEIVVGLVIVMSGVGVLTGVAGGFTHIEAFFHQPLPVIFGALAPFLLIAGIILIPVSGCTFAIAGAPWARAYRDLAGVDLAATFS